MTGSALPKLGRRPPADHVRSALPRLGAFARRTPILPPAPEWWDGTTDVVYPLYRNDQLGDCTAVALAHLLATQAAAEYRCLQWTDEQIVSFYRAITGGPDTGACEVDVLWRVAALGFPLAGVSRLAAWSALHVADQDLVRAAAAQFRGLYVGAMLPLTAQDATDGACWDIAVDPSDPRTAPGSWGGHAMALVAYDPFCAVFATWGRLQRATWEWVAAYVDEAYVVLDADRASLSDVDFVALRNAVRALRTV